MTSREIISENLEIIKKNYDLLRMDVWLFCTKKRIGGIKN